MSIVHVALLQVMRNQARCHCLDDALQLSGVGQCAANELRCWHAGLGLGRCACEVDDVPPKRPAALRGCEWHATVRPRALQWQEINKQGAPSRHTCAQNATVAAGESSLSSCCAALRGRLSYAACAQAATSSCTVVARRCVNQPVLARSVSDAAAASTLL